MLQPFSKTYAALIATGKFPNLTHECLILTARGFPGARLETGGHQELVEAAKSIPGVIGDPHAWLLRKIGNMESRKMAKQDGGGRKGARRPEEGQADRPKSELLASSDENLRRAMS